MGQSDGDSVQPPAHISCHIITIHAIISNCLTEQETGEWTLWGNGCTRDGEDDVEEEHKGGGEREESIRRRWEKT